MSSGRIARSFFPINTDPELSDLLFSRSTELPGDAKRCLPVSAAEGLRNYKGALDRVVAVAGNPLTDPQVLAKYAKDPRVSVRRELIANPSTPYPALFDLALWALDRQDDEMAAAVGRLTLADIAAVDVSLAERNMKARLDRCDLGATSLRSRVEEQPAHAVALACLGNRELTVELALAAYEGKLEGVALADIVAADLSAADAILYCILQRRDMLTVELAEVWTRWSSKAEATDPRRFTSLRHVDHLGQSVEPFKQVEEGAADILVSRGNTLGQFQTGMLSGASEAVLRERLACADVKTVRMAIETLELRELGPETERVLTDRFREIALSGDNPVVTHRLLGRLRHALPDDVLVELLRHGDYYSTCRWISQGTLPNGPRSGVVRRVWRKPGKAFTEPNGSKMDPSDNTLWLSLLDAAGDDPRLIGDLVTLYDAKLGTRLAHGKVARAVYPLVAERLAGASKAAAWEMFLTLGAEWDDSLTALIATCQSLTEGPVEADDRSDQLTLL